MRVALLVIIVLLSTADIAAGDTVAGGRISEAALTGERVVYVRTDAEGEELVEAREGRQHVLARSRPREVEGAPLRIVRLEATDEAVLAERVATSDQRIPRDRRRDVAGLADRGELREVERCRDGACTCSADAGGAAMQLDLHRARAVVAHDGCGKGVRIVLLGEDASPRTLARIPHGAYPDRIGGSDLDVAGRYVAWTKALRDGSARQQVTVYDWRARRALYRWRAPRLAGRTGRLQVDLDSDGRAVVNACNGGETRCLTGWLSSQRDGLQRLRSERVDVSWDRAGRAILRRADTVEVHDLLLGLERRAAGPTDARLLDATGTCLLLERVDDEGSDGSADRTVLTMPFPGLSPDACPA